jgi:hypothetical protein
MSAKPRPLLPVCLTPDVPSFDTRVCITDASHCAHRRHHVHSWSGGWYSCSQAARIRLLHQYAACSTFLACTHAHAHTRALPRCIAYLGLQCVILWRLLCSAIAQTACRQGLLLYSCCGGLCKLVPTHPHTLTSTHACKQEKLAFPSGQATYETIAAMATAGSLAIDRGRYLLRAAIAAALFTLCAYFVPQLSDPPILQNIGL